MPRFVVTTKFDLMWANPYFVKSIWSELVRAWLNDIPGHTNEKKFWRKKTNFFSRVYLAHFHARQCMVGLIRHVNTMTRMLFKMSVEILIWKIVFALALDL